MLVYSQQTSSRLTYVLDFISREIFNEPIKITNDRQTFYQYERSKINYSKHRVSNNELWIYNADLLFETNVKAQPVICFEATGNKAFFQNDTSDYPFDIFAAIFYLISRYEEYLPHTKDKFGRYAHVNSLAHQEGFLHLPLVNIWLHDFKKTLLLIFPGLQFSNQHFSFSPTYDIDIAWSYRNKGWWRNTGGFLRSLIKLDLKAVKERLAVILKNEKDPFDSYEWLHDMHKHLQLSPIYFFLMAFKQKRFDKNISPFKKNLQNLIREHESLYATGIHPSWQSGDDDAILEEEIKLLQKISGHDVINSRQHYLRFTIPVTYQKLISAGIKSDYSMGYGTVNGFRASVASVFYWYDLEKETVTDLIIHPFCFMDANAYYELKLSPDQALSELMNFYKVIKEVNGLMITLWHNNFLGTDTSFAGWREVYESFLKEIGDVKELNFS